MGFSNGSDVSPSGAAGIAWNLVNRRIRFWRHERLPLRLTTWMKSQLLENLREAITLAEETYAGASAEHFTHLPEN